MDSNESCKAGLIYLAYALIIYVLFTPKVTWALADLENGAGRKLTDEPFHLSAKNGLLTLRAQGADLRKILHQISQKTSTKIEIHPDVTGTINTSFRDLPLPEALKRITDNLAIVSIKEMDQPNDRVLKVAIFASSHAKVQSKSLAALQNPPRPPPPKPANRFLEAKNNSHQKALTPIQSQRHKNNFKSRAAPNELVVKFSKGLSHNDIQALNARLGATIKTRIKALNYYVLTLPAQLSADEALVWYRQQNVVDIIEPNYLIPIKKVPADPDLSQQWALHNSGQSGGTTDADIDAVEAWDVAQGREAVIIAVIDTGVDYTHEDLVDNIRLNPNEIPNNGIDDDNNGYIDDVRGWDFVDASAGAPDEDFQIPDNDPMDRHGHGTHVAGIAGAITNNGLGIAGVAWNCKIMPVRAGYKTTSGAGILESDDAAQAIVYAAENDAKVINLSWGDFQKSNLIEDALRFATDKGAIICAAAGNENSSNYLYPAASENIAVLAVGATDNQDERASFSNYGNWVDVSAPGVDIYSTYINNSYHTMSGTSMAAPHVAGVAALVFSYFENISAIEVKTRIMRSVDVLANLYEKNATSGRINAYSALIGIHTISGHILDADGLPIEGVLVEADNYGGSDTTDSDGYYEFLVPENWSGKVTLSKEGFVFNPSEMIYANVTADQPNRNFAAEVPIAIEFQVFQSIPTNGANDWEFFTIEDNHYLIVANYRSDSTRDIDSKIYKWNGSNFIDFQSLATVGANKWKFFTFDNNYYLVVANFRSDSTYNIDSLIYKWNGTNFQEFQSIPTKGAIDWEFFTIEGSYYLAVANHYDKSAYTVNSKIYKWNNTDFQEFQSIPTSGAHDWEFFMIENKPYLALANTISDTTRNIDSKLFEWDGTSFKEFQSIPTSGAYDWEFFSFNGNNYLAIANANNDSSNNTDSRIYQWNGTNFQEFQSLPTNGAKHWEFFTIDNIHYLALANYSNDSTRNIDSKIYGWNGTKFEAIQSIPTHGAIAWEYFSIDSTNYLAVANYQNESTRDIDSNIYYLTGVNISAARSHDEPCNSGENIEICLNVTHEGSLSALGLEETIPDGWTFSSVAGDDAPAVYPAAGATGLLEFAWTAIPASPIDFCYSVQVPDSDTGTKILTGELIYRKGAGSEQIVTVQPDPDPIQQCTYHTGDYYPADWSINLSELLRCIQIYNVGEYCCDSLGEDGFRPGPGDQCCGAHDSDYNPQDWTIDFSELLRVIQFYNIGAYHVDSGGEDGYAAGEAPSANQSILSAASLSASHSTADYSPENETMVTMQIKYSDTLSAIGIEANLPAGWSFLSVGELNKPDLSPSIGKTGTLNFAWITAPVSPFEFSYSVNVPADSAGTQQLSAKVKYRRLAGELIESVQPDPLVFKKCGGDFNEDGDVDGEDLLEFSKDEKGVTLDRFAEKFGRIDCH